jgi:hypothetical protein
VLDLNSILAAVNCFQQLRGNAELKELLAAAQQVQSQVTANSEEFKQYMRAVMQFFMDLKQDQAALLKAVHVNRPARGDSELLKRRFILDSSSVTWEKQPVGHGGSACVYPGFFHGHPVVVKILHMSVDEQQQAEVS